jgi:hypothetical protein
VLAAREAFPQVATPTAFKPRAELISEGPGAYPSGDMAMLASERASAQPDMPMWILIAAFVVSVGLGIGVTVAIGLAIR